MIEETGEEVCGAVEDCRADYTVEVMKEDTLAF